MANPLIKLELLRRFRSQSAAWAIPLLVLLPGVAVTLIYASATAPSVTNFGFDGEPVGGRGFAVGDLQAVGLSMFAAVTVTMLVALLLMVPSMVGGSISGERHNQTLQPLQLTAMTPTQIVLGKMVASVSYLLALLLCAAPVMTIPFLLGGVTATHVVGAYVVLVLITIEYAAISLAVSAALARPGPSIMISLVTCAFLTVAPWVATGMAFMLQSRNLAFEAEQSAARYLASPSPLALASWVPLGDDVDLPIHTGDRVASLAWYLLVIAGCCWFARSRVVAPVERDR